MKPPRLWVARAARFSKRALTRVAAVLALLALGLMSLGILYPKPLLVIVAMSVGHAIGVAAVLAYFLAVVLDVAKVGVAPDSLAPAGPRTPSPVPAPPDETPDSSGRRGPADKNPE